MIETILVSSVILTAALVKASIASVSKIKTNYFAYSRNEAKAPCNMEDYKFASRKQK